MIENLPTYISLIFGLTTVATLILFYWMIKKSNLESTRKTATIILFSLIIWLLFQAVLSLKNVYNTELDIFPPKIFLYGVMPAILTIIILFTSRRGRQFIDSLPLLNLTYLHIIRIPVELILFWLFVNKAIPQLMTFEGRNFDIVAGITAPFVAYFGLTKGIWSRQLILAWNFICLALLLNIVVNAFLSAPFPVQKFAFDQPNIAVLNFPFSWLPTLIVPVVLFSHLASIRQLLKRQII
jgi:hypothetical protein